MKILYLLAFTTILWGCDYDKFSDSPPLQDLNVQPNADISIIRRLHNEAPVTVNADIIVGGWVVANDRGGNFYRSFIIQDQTGALEIKAALFEMHNKFPLGQYVLVRAQGMTVGIDNGVVQLGLGVYGNTGSPDYIYYPAILRNYVNVDNDNRIQAPVLTSIENINESLYGRLVRIEGLVVDQGQGDKWTDDDGYSSYNYRFFADANGNRIATLVSSYADFAGALIPVGTVSITGILMYGKANGRNSLILKIRDSDDVKNI